MGTYTDANGCSYVVADSVLTISVGTSTSGEMQDFTSDYTVADLVNNETFRTVQYTTGITKVGDYAFYNCTSLGQILYGNPSTLRIIGNYAYYNCNLNTGQVFGDKVGNYAYANNTFMTMASVSNVLDIGTHIFSGCTGLVNNVFLSDGLTRIPDAMFKNCSSMLSISIPKSVISIGADAFSGCTSLSSFQIPDGVTSIGGAAFYGCSSIQFIKIPDGVTKINGHTFDGCSNLRTTVIPKNVTEVGEYAYRGCVAMERILFKGAQPTLGLYSFNLSGTSSSEVTSNVYSPGWASLDVFPIHYIRGNYTTLNFPTIPRDSNNNLYLVVSVTLYIWGDSQSTLRMSDSENSNWVRTLVGEDFISINIDDDIQYIGTHSFDSYNYGGSTLAVDTMNGVTAIGADAFRNTHLSSITLPNTLITLGSRVFEECTELKMVTLSNHMTSISYGAFNGCTALESVSPMPDSVTLIDSFAFYNCNKLESIIIGSNVTSIGWLSFYDCTSLSSVDIADSVTTISDMAFANCTGITTLRIGNSVTEIGSDAFMSCTNIVSLEIGNSLESIRAGAFEQCANLSTLVIGSGVTTIYGQAFKGCSLLTSIWFKGSQAPTTIGDDAFSLGTESSQTTTLIYSPGWANDTVFPSYTHEYTTFIYLARPPGTFMKTDSDTWSRATDIWIKVNGTWVRTYDNRIKCGSDWRYI